MATRQKKTVNELRLEALAMLKKAKEMEVAEKREKFFKVGTIVTRYVDGEITAKEMKDEVKKLTGKEYPSEKTATPFNNTPASI